MVENINFEGSVKILKKWTHGVGLNYFMLVFHIPKKIERLLGLKDKQRVRVIVEDRSGFNVKILKK